VPEYDSVSPATTLVVLVEKTLEAMFIFVGRRAGADLAERFHASAKSDPMVKEVVSMASQPAAQPNPTQPNPTQPNQI
jgi:hypothetical protein